MPIVFRPIHAHNQKPMQPVFNGNYYQAPATAPKTITGVQININGNQYVNNNGHPPPINGVQNGVFAYGNPM